jgi:hypothetical protein
MTQDDLLRRFCEMFEAYPTTSDRKFYKRTMVSWSEYNDPNVNYVSETVNATALHIPDHKMEDFLRVAVDEERFREMQIRDNVPAVKIAYERYRLLLKMCGGDYAGY